MTGRDGDSQNSRYDRLRAVVGVAPATPGSDEAVSVLHRLCTSAVTRLSVTGAAISLMSGTGSDGVAAAADSRSHALAELQFTTGEGPCHDAFAARRPVLMPDLAASDGRWPGYTSAAVESGARAVFAFPLYVGGAGFGVFEVSHDRPGSLDQEQVAEALTYAQLATDILLDGRLTTPKGDLEPGLASALDYRSEIHQAQGMLMVTLGVTMAEALVRMRSYAFTQNRPLIDVARDVHEGHALEDGT